jgi:hypothetical protein
MHCEALELSATALCSDTFFEPIMKAPHPTAEWIYRDHRGLFYLRVHPDLILAMLAIGHQPEVRCSQQPAPSLAASTHEEYRKKSRKPDRAGLTFGYGD